MKILKIIVTILSLLIVAFSSVYGNYKIGESEYLNAEKNKTVITLWQVDAFEGGTGSRRSFLMKVARIFEKSNPNILVSVAIRTPEGAVSDIKNGQKPDMISFSSGMDLDGFKELDNISKTFSAGKVGGVQYAIPWAKSGYFLILKDGANESDLTIDDIVVSEGDYTLARLAIYSSGFDFFNAQVKTPIDAYHAFLTSNKKAMVGTIRDLVRISNYDGNFKVIFLSGFTDLLQYIAVFSTDKNKNIYSQKFIDLLLSDSVQKSLADIKLFSPYILVDGEDEFYQTQNKSVKYTISAFTGKSGYQKIKSAFNDNLSKNELEIKIKNMLIYLDNFIKV